MQTVARAGVVMMTTPLSSVFEVLRAVFDPIGVLGVDSAPAQGPYGAWKAAKTPVNQNGTNSCRRGWNPRLARVLAKCG